MSAPANGSLKPGKPTPLGSFYDGSGTYFALYSAAAHSVTLCLIDDDGTEHQIPITTTDGHIWHIYVAGIAPGQRYGYRIDGDWDPQQGALCNPSKFLVDPYAKAFDGEYQPHDALLGYQIGNPDIRDEEDSLPYSMTSVVVADFFNWGDDRRLRHPMADTVIYEAHVRGLTQRNPEVPEEIRGTYAGLVHPSVLEYLAGLGITAIELLPVHQFLHDRRLLEMGLRNYWGYNSFGFFAPHRDYSSLKNPGGQVAEFKKMVKTFHKAGIEVILDVVYNHTAEGSAEGPTLNFKGIDNRAYYHLSKDDPSSYFDFTGCGNSVNMRHPYTLQLVLDSLRYWVEEMHVDGFRFDLAVTLTRGDEAVDMWGNFISAVQQDPVLSQVKLIAEPWDLGYGGYQVGGFPYPWSEWNGKFRDTMREFWCGNPDVLGEFAGRLTGSADFYAHTNRRPFNSINFITAHDGFTMRDLVTYNQKNNEANGEDNRDGESHNRNWNCGVEGPSDDPKIQALRLRQQRNMLATLFLSQGTPMLLHGDEVGRTQGGNNNVYCQDNEISWMDWEAAKDPQWAGLHSFTQALIELRHKHPIFRQSNFFTGENVPADSPTESHLNDTSQGLPDVIWMTPNGKEMEPADWDNAFAASIMVFLNGHANATPNPLGGLHGDSSFLMLFNASHDPCTFHIPDELCEADSNDWHFVLNTAEEVPECPTGEMPAESMESTWPDGEKPENDGAADTFAPAEDDGDPADAESVETAELPDVNSDPDAFPVSIPLAADDVADGLVTGKVDTKETNLLVLPPHTFVLLEQEP